MTEKQVKDTLASIRAAIYKLEQHFVEEELAKKGGPSPRPKPSPLDDPHESPHPSPHESPHPSPHGPPP